jgi:hypothetical protein
MEATIFKPGYRRKTDFKMQHKESAYKYLALIQRAQWQM